VSRRWTYAIPLLTLTAGALFAAGAVTARGTDLRGGGGRTKLIAQIEQENDRIRLDRSSYQRLREDIDRISRTGGDVRVKEAQAEADVLAGRAGFTPLTGAGVRVVLDDAPPNRTFPDDVDSDSLLVHQQDVQAVVNALWAGGATGMQIMDQRLIDTSAVRCVGNTLILQGVVYSPPFRITATGDPVRLRAALDASPEISLYKDFVSRYGLGYAVRNLDRVTLPAFAGSVGNRYATVLK
jgi:uncharacterized protein YlxW (UPF0749 family)